MDPEAQDRYTLKWLSYQLQTQLVAGAALTIGTLAGLGDDLTLGMFATLSISAVCAGVAIVSTIRSSILVWPSLCMAFVVPLLGASIALFCLLGGESMPWVLLFFYICSLPSIYASRIMIGNSMGKR